MLLGTKKNLNKFLMIWDLNKDFLVLFVILNPSQLHIKPENNALQSTPVEALYSQPFYSLWIGQDYIGY